MAGNEIKELKQKSPTELLLFAEANDVENGRQCGEKELMFPPILSSLHCRVSDTARAVVEISRDGSPSAIADANYLRGRRSFTSPSPN